jgi:hypothetical protein
MFQVQLRIEQFVLSGIEGNDKEFPLADLERKSAESGAGVFFLSEVKVEMTTTWAISRPPSALRAPARCR